MIRMTYAQWVAEGTRLFGEDRMKWRFVCPSCGVKTSVAEYQAVGASENAVAFSCIGRFVPTEQRGSVVPAFAGGEQVTGSRPRIGCTYAGGGLFRINPIHVEDPKKPGVVHQLFAFDEGGS